MFPRLLCAAKGHELGSKKQAVAEYLELPLELGESCSTGVGKENRDKIRTCAACSDHKNAPAAVHRRSLLKSSRLKCFYIPAGKPLLICSVPPHIAAPLTVDSAHISFFLWQPDELMIMPPPQLSSAGGLSVLLHHCCAAKTLSSGTSFGWDMTLNDQPRAN